MDPAVARDVSQEGVDRLAQLRDVTVHEEVLEERVLRLGEQVGEGSGIGRVAGLDALRLRESPLAEEDLLQLLRRSQVDLLADHLDAYADLASAQVRATRRALATRALLVALAGLSALLALLLAGMALLLWAALSPELLARPWMLLLIPALPALLALGAAWALRSSAPLAGFGPLREQFSRDAQMLHDASRP